MRNNGRKGIIKWIIKLVATSVVGRRRNNGTHGNAILLRLKRKDVERSGGIIRDKELAYNNCKKYLSFFSASRFHGRDFTTANP